MENPPETIPLQGTRCPSCGQTVPQDAFFCPYCAAILKEKPPSLGQQITVYLVSLFLPPLGLGYAWKYLKRSDAASKKLGWTAVVLTVISIVITVWISASALNSVNQQLNGLTNFSM